MKAILITAALVLGGCTHTHQIIVNCPVAGGPGPSIPAVTDEALVQALKDGGTSATIPDGGTLEFGEGSNGIWYVGAPAQTFSNTLGRIFVDYNAGSTPKWTETVVVVDYPGWTTPTTPLEVEHIDPSNVDPNTYITLLPSGTKYWDTTFQFDYLNPPSSSSINNLPGNLTGAAYLVNNGTTLQGWMFRRSLGGDQYQDHWLFMSSYQFPKSGSVDTRIATESGGKTNLKGWLLEKVGGAAWYVQVTYTFTQHTKP